MLEHVRAAFCDLEGTHPSAFLQVACAVPGRPVQHRSWGSARPGVAASDHHLVNMWCTTKPVVAMAALAVVEREGLDPAAPLRTMFRDHDLLRHADYSLLSVLAHDGPGHRLDSLQAMLLAPLRRRQASIQALAGGRQSGYSEFLGWLLLGEVLAECESSTPERAMEGWLDSAGLAASIRFPSHERPIAEDELAFHRVPYAGSFWWMGHDRMPSVQCADRVAMGGYATAKGLVAFLERTRDVLAGATVPAFPSSEMLATALAHRPESRWEETLGRTGILSGGFMIDLASQGYAPLGHRSLGHSGLLGTSGMALDLSSGTALAYAWGDLDFDQARADERRRRILERMLAGTDA